MENLYEILQSPEYSEGDYRKRNLDEDMVVVEQMFYKDWRPRFLIDERDKFAFEFASSDLHLLTVKVEDIDFSSIRGLNSPFAIDCARNLLLSDHSSLDSYSNGVAEFWWCLYFEETNGYLDDDGYGMTPNEEVQIVGFIDRRGKVVSRMRDIHYDLRLLDVMRAEAEANAMNSLKQ